MSYYKELLNERWMDRLDVAIESFSDYREETVSTEGLSFKQMGEAVKKLINRIANFFVNVYKQIKDRIVQFFSGKNVKKVAEEVEVLIKSDVIKEIPDEAFDKSVKEFVAETALHVSDATDQKAVEEKIKEVEQERTEYEEKKNTILSRLKDRAKEGDGDENVLADVKTLFEGYSSWNYYMVFNNDGVLFDVDALIKIVEQDISIADAIYGIDVSDRYLALHSVHKTLGPIFDINGSVEGHILAVKITKNQVYAALPKLPEMIRKAVAFGNKYTRLHEQKLNELDKQAKDIFDSKKLKYDRNIEYNEDDYFYGESKRRYDELMLKCHILRSIIAASMLPYRTIMMYIMLLRHLNKDIFGNQDYVTTANPPAPKLYHISRSPVESIGSEIGATGVFEPGLSRSGNSQFLPPRVSFSPSILQCCIGTPYIFERYYDPGNQDYPYVFPTVHVYEGMPDENTRYIKPKIMSFAVGEYHNSKEVAVTTPITLKYLGMAKIKVTRLLHTFDPNKYIGYKFVEDEYEPYDEDDD